MIKKRFFSGKKGIMIEFLVTVLLALIIFIPTCLFVSKLFRTSDQALDDFHRLNQELKNFAGSNLEKDSFLYILDKKTFLVLFKDKEEVLVSSREQDIGATGPTLDPEGLSGSTLLVQNSFFSYPEKGCLELPCSCLCREFAEDPVRGSLTEEGGKTTIKLKLSCKQLVCESLGEVELAKSFSVYRGEDVPRRIPLSFAKKEGIDVSIKR